MHVVELEEGEACSLQEDALTFDPDVNLSYIGEKVQILLGHFQKDFDGGISAESLGSKFGGYGSFLPASLRSPISSCARSPRSRISDSLRPSKPSGLEENCAVSVLPSSARDAKPEVHDSSKTPDVIKSSKQVGCPERRMENNSSNAKDQKNLRVRIKVGSDNILNHKAAEICSGLGLDVSPSSSVEDILSGSERLKTQGPRDVQNQSPTSILQLYSFLLRDEMLLSPLCDDLLDLIAPDKLISFVDSKPLEIQNDLSANRSNHSVTLEQNKKILVKNEEKEKYPVLSESEIGKNGDVDCQYSLLKCKMSICSVKVPFLANSSSPKDRKEKCADLLSDVPREEMQSDSMHLENTGKTEGVVEKVSDAESEKNPQKSSVSSQVVNAVGPSHYIDSKAWCNFKDASTNNSSSSTGRCVHESSLNVNVDQKIAHSTDGKLKISGSKDVEAGKFEGCRITDKDMSRGNSLSLHQKSKGGSVDSRMPVTVQEKCKAGESFKKATTADRCMNFFGDLKQQNSNGLETSDSLRNRHKDLDVAEKCVAKPMEQLPREEVHVSSNDVQLTGCTNAAPIKDTITNYDTPTASVAPAITKDDWVCCDKCQKWRLLPRGRNPEDLPDKWICSMLNWLPGMNLCDISEEETTEALNAHYQVPVPDSQNAASCMGVVDLVKHRRKKEPQQLSSMSEEDFMGRSMDVGPHKHKQKDKHLMLANRLDRGNSKINRKNKGKIDEDNSWFSKKGKLESGLDNGDEGLSNPDGAFLKSSTSGLATDLTSKNGLGSCSSKQVTCDGKNRPQDVTKQSKVEVMTLQDSNMKVMTAIDDQDCLKKRKPHDLFHNESLHRGPVAIDGGWCSAKGPLSETEPARVKRVKMLSDKRGSRDSEVNGRINNEVCSSKDREAREQTRGMFPQNLGHSDSLRRNLKNFQPSFATTSSSSKVSGSQKQGTSFHYSPVESVTSSTLRMRSSPGIFASSQRDVVGKDRHRANEFSKRCSTGDSPKVDQRKALKKNRHSSTKLHKRQDSLLGFQDRSKSRALNLSQSTGDQPNLVRRFPCKDPLVVSQFDDDKMRDGSHESHLKSFSDIFSGMSKDNKHVSDEAFETDKVKAPNALNDPHDYAEPYRGNASGRQHQSKSICEVGKAENLQTSGKSSCMINSNDRSFTPCAYVDKTDFVTGNRKSLHLLPTMKNQCERPMYCASGSRKGSDIDAFCVDDDGKCEVVKHDRKIDILSGSRHKVSRKDSFNQASITALQEARNLKHMADRLKNAGSDLESCELYFQAALKFLHAAFLSESCNSGDGSRHGDPIKIYSTTAEMCAFCAHEYERFNDMASASLVYKCMEVAYMRAVYSSHTSVNRVCHEIQKCLKFPHTELLPAQNRRGESPTSLESDADNLNNAPANDEITSVEGATASQPTRNHVIAAQIQPNDYERLLTFTQRVDLAMKASTKSRSSFAAIAARPRETQCLSPIRRALDFNFQDMEGLLRLVRLALEAIGRG